MRKEERTADITWGRGMQAPQKRKIRREYSITSRKKRRREEEHAVNRKEKSEKERIEKREGNHAVT